MHAVIVTGGQQYKVKEGQTVKVEKLELATGASINFENVLLIADGENIEVGQPYVAGAKVTAEVVAHGRHKKVNIIKFRRRKHSCKRMGHRQWFSELKISVIESGAAK